MHFSARCGRGSGCGAATPTSPRPQVAQEILSFGRHRAATLLTVGGSLALIPRGCSSISTRTERMQEHHVAGRRLDELEPSDDRP